MGVAVLGAIFRGDVRVFSFGYFGIFGGCSVDRIGVNVGVGRDGCFWVASWGWRTFGF